jgi:dTDP-4-dehydrorhamnose reductase
VGPALLARAARRHGARIVQVSTDYVFDGTAREPYPEDQAPAPLSAYGRTKAAGEWAVRAEHPGGHLVLRTAWLYGGGGGCFPKTIARLVAERGTVDVVDDQVGAPTWSRDVAELIRRLVVADVPPGTYHGTAAGEVSWCGFAREVVRSVGHDTGVVRPTTTQPSARRAPRPSYSVLGGRALETAGVPRIGPWRERWALAAPEVLGQRGPGSNSSSR